MLPYQYTRLSDEGRDIRLLALLPGVYDDAIILHVSHVPLVKPAESEIVQMTMSELQKTLPSGWGAYRTVEGRVIFEDEETENTRWEHPDANIEASIYDAELENPPPGFKPLYEALSYTWGSPKDPVTVYVTGPSKPDTLSTLHIGQSLAGALRHIRYTDKTRVLWIDAICIDQSNMQERNTQVQRMADVYKLAHKVLVWLGPEENDSSVAISALRYIGRQLELLQDNMRVRAPEATELDWYQTWSKLPFLASTWDAILSLIQRPWFYRVWILQEVQLANSLTTMFCGSDEISWPCMRRALICLWNKSSQLSYTLHEQLMALNSLTIDQRGMPIGSLLLRNVDRKCTDSRDKIYGILGLAHPSFVARITVDYSLSVGDTYKAAFLAYMGQSNRLEALRYCDLEERGVESPSWVPDWSSSADYAYSGGQIACGVSCADATYIGPELLEVSGVLCDVIHEVSQPAPKDPIKTMQMLQDWEPQDSSSRIYITGETLLEAYTATICRNWLRERYPQYDEFPTMTAWTKKYVSQISNRSNPSSLEGIEDGDIFRALKICQGRTFFVTEKGYVGLGPVGTKRGDSLCVLLGCSMPILLRRKPETTSYHQVVGQCYVRGFEDSEGLLGPLPAPWVVQFYHDPMNILTHQYYNPSNEVRTQEDPRLPPLASDCEIIDTCRTADDPEMLQKFRNKVTGEIMKSDPRLLPETLKEYNESLRTFDLI